MIKKILLITLAFQGKLLPALSINTYIKHKSEGLCRRTIIYKKVGTLIKEKYPTVVLKPEDRLGGQEGQEIVLQQRDIEVAHRLSIVIERDEQKYTEDIICSKDQIFYAYHPNSIVPECLPASQIKAGYYLETSSDPCSRKVESSQEHTKLTTLYDIYSMNNDLTVITISERLRIHCKIDTAPSFKEENNEIISTHTNKASFSSDITN